MNALVYDAFQAPPEVRSVSDPEPAPGGVVLEVKATGICRSDWHGWMGHDPIIDPPHVPGHEVVGVIADVGSEVRRWAVGDRVTVPFVGGCGACEECAAGHPQVCPDQFQPGFTGPGALAEYVAIDYADDNLVALPETLDAVTGASLGCRFSTAFRAVVDQGEVGAGDWVAVHGCGGVGLSAVMIARAAGARVVGVDVSDRALERAETLGAEATVHAREVEDVVTAVRDATGGGAHVSIDALGDPETCAHSVANLRRRGRHVQVGLLTGPDLTPVPMDRVVAEELELRGVHGIQAHRYPALFALIESGRLDPGQLVGRTVDLAEAGTVLATMGTADRPGVTVVDTFD